MSFLGDFVNSQIRKEMKNRTQESLAATAGLTQALKNDTQALKKLLGTADPTVVAEFKISLMQVKTSEEQLAKALNEHLSVLKDILVKIGG